MAAEMVTHCDKDLSVKVFPSDTDAAPQKCAFSVGALGLAFAAGCNGVEWLKSVGVQ